MGSRFMGQRLYMNNSSLRSVGVIDYGIGNLASLVDAFALAGACPSLVRSPADLASYDRFVLPGVGSFATAMLKLRQEGWLEPILRSVAAGKSMLGICVGMQLLFDVGYEDGETEGLGLFRGSVVRLPSNPGFKVPHIGWNSLEITSGEEHLVSRLKPNVDVYFCHSFHCKPDEPSVVAALTFHGLEFASVVAKENVIGVQFHPEKSQSPGLNLLRDFAAGKLVEC